MSEKFNKLFPIMKSILGNHGNVNRVDYGISLWNHIIRPALEYACELLIFSSTDMEKLERMQRTVGKFILGACRYTANEAVLGDLGWITMKSRNCFCGNKKLKIITFTIVLGVVIFFNKYGYIKTNLMQDYEKRALFMTSHIPVNSHESTNSTGPHPSYNESNVKETGINMVCENIVNGFDVPAETMNQTIRFLRSTHVSDLDFLSLTDNCTRFSTERGYSNKPVTDEEMNFPLAFGLSMYTSAHQVEQLLRTIYRPHNIYCIHVDNKSSSVLHRAMESISGCFDNVFISSRLEKVIYASVSQIHAEMNCQRDVLKRNKKWKYFIYLTGQEFPLKTNLEIVEILKEFQEQNDISIEMTVPWKRVTFRYSIVNGKMHRTNQTKTEPCPLKTLKKGTIHTSLSRKFVEFLHTSNIAERFLVWLNDTLSPDEHFFQSLAYLPEAPGGPGQVPMSQPVMALSRRAMWQSKLPSPQCHGHYVREFCIFSWRDLAWLVKQPHLFANKFNVKHDSLVLDCLEEIIKYRTIYPKQLNITVYQKFVKNRSWKDFEDPPPWQVK
uniref:Beta-1,3-galactosyl-O-glycosyl-glycoprotein beta-1,6-N-acetylglucosaminyltransferase-like n=1 Tax=Saccoglossus kowalevskii TaxID=10224 RepID=A0ABM0GZA4_SACKO|nr:PREDICTED: beta-1,3-galactosyl-O-glycosyl-glycoprotein beta-1,6-N-acetylglucosaminyltransferase-like [Saccoglossus kowalevskii]